jgi:hypothetical protein
MNEIFGTPLDPTKQSILLPAKNICPNLHAPCEAWSSIPHPDDRSNAWYFARCCSQIIKVKLARGRHMARKSHDSQQQEYFFRECQSVWNSAWHFMHDTHYLESFSKNTFVSSSDNGLILPFPVRSLFNQNHLHVQASNLSSKEDAETESIKRPGARKLELGFLWWASCHDSCASVVAHAPDHFAFTPFYLPLLHACTRGAWRFARIDLSVKCAKSCCSCAAECACECHNCHIAPPHCASRSQAARILGGGQCDFLFFSTVSDENVFWLLQTGSFQSEFLNTWWSPACYNHELAAAISLLRCGRSDPFILLSIRIVPCQKNTQYPLLSFSRHKRSVELVSHQVLLNPEGKYWVSILRGCKTVYLAPLVSYKIPTARAPWILSLLSHVHGQWLC